VEWDLGTRRSTDEGAAATAAHPFGQFSIGMRWIFDDPRAGGH